MKLSLLYIFFFLPLSIFGQINKEEGEIRLKNGAAIKGEISYFYNDQESGIILNERNEGTRSFQKEEVNEIMLYSGKKFVSKKYGHKGDSTVLILQSLIESPEISIYLANEDGSDFFYVSKNDLLYKLENNKINIERNGKSFSRYDHKYKGTLTILMSDQEGFGKKIEKVKYSENDFVKIVNEYNKGNLTYLWSTDNKFSRESNWLLYGHYSNYASYFHTESTGNSFGLFFGGQYYISKSSRSSFKMALDNSYFNSKWNKDKIVSLSLKYQYEVIQKQKYNFYLNGQLVDFSFISSTGISSPKTRNQEPNNNFGILPRLSPGLGIEFKPSPNYYFFVELNHLFQLQLLPKNFSIGMKYDIQ